MTTPNHPTGQPANLWRWYTTASEAARNSYLATTYAAHRMYLTGPWPDREAYQRVENTAWDVYYTAARGVWRRYTAAIDCPCCTADPYTVNDCTCPGDCGVYWCQARDDNTGATPTRDAGGDLDEFDQRQETYPAADPNRRDNH